MRPMRWGTFGYHQEIGLRSCGATAPANTASASTKGGESASVGPAPVPRKWRSPTTTKEKGLARHSDHVATSPGRGTAARIPRAARRHPAPAGGGYRCAAAPDQRNRAWDAAHQRRHGPTTGAVLRNHRPVLDEPPGAL